MSFNLNNIIDIPAAEIEIKDETGAPTGVFFEMAGPQHPKRKAIAFSVSRKNIAKFQKAGKMELPDPEEADQLNKEHLAAFTLGWRGWVDDKGDAVPYTPSAALALYGDDTKAWLVDQLQAAINERERFMKRSVKA